MKSFKLTPLVVFLLLLIVLAISIYMRNSYFVEGVENMFNNKGQFSEFILPEYSQVAPLTQLTETIFYDKKNGNIVEAVVEWTPASDDTTDDAATDDAATGDDDTGDATTGDATTGDATTGDATTGDATTGAATTGDATTGAATTGAAVSSQETFTNIEGHENMGSQHPILRKLIITPRNGGDSYIYDFNQKVQDPLPTQESLYNTVDNVCVTWSYVSQSEFAPETTVFYIPWKNDTYISIYEKTDDNKMTPRGVFHFSKERHSVINVKQVDITNSTNTQDDNNNKYVRDEKYGEHDLYQLDKFVLYDIPTSNLIVRNEHNTGSINIYKGDGKEISLDVVNKMYDDNKTHENQEKYAELKAWTAFDRQGENIITYIKNADKTLVFICGFESSTMDTLILKNVRRFTLYGIDICDKVEKPTPVQTTECGKEESKEETKSEDYILKTQIVPPVCPTCPMCPKDVTCTNCGGNGGSGTKTTNGKSIIGDTVGEVTDLARDATSGAVELGRDATSGAVELGRDAVGGVVDLGREIVGGATGLVRDATGGATGLVRDVTGGAFGLVRDAGSGVAHILTPEQQRQQQVYGNGRMGYQQTEGTQSQYYGTNNNYSRYGALPDRPSNFIPRTADFSSFA